MNRQYGALSGIAVVLIAWNHAVHFGLQTAPLEGGWLYLVTSLQALGTFAVPAFLFISGAFVAYAARELSITFIRRSLERVLWPYVVWSLLFYVIVGVTGREQHSIAGHIKNLIVGYPYHFIPLLSFWYVASLLLVRIGKPHPWVLLGVVGLVQAVLLVLEYPGAVVQPGTIPSWLFALKPPIVSVTLADWGIYFPLGLVVALHESRWRRQLVAWRWALVGATAALFGAGALSGFGLVSLPWARLIVPLPLMLVLPIIDRQRIPLAAFFEKLGRRSYGIYLEHFVVINLCVLLVVLIPALRALPYVVIPIFFAAAIGVPMLTMDVMARKAAMRKIYRYVFGAVPPAIDVRRAAGPRLSQGAQVGAK